MFLFDKVVIVCKRRGYSYELKEVIELLLHKVTDDPTNNKDLKKVGPPSSGPYPAGAGRDAPRGRCAGVVLGRGRGRLERVVTLTWWAAVGRGLPWSAVLLLL